MKNNNHPNTVSQRSLRRFLFVLILLGISADPSRAFVANPENILTAYALLPSQLNALDAIRIDKLASKNPKLDSALTELVSVHEVSTQSEQGWNHFNRISLSQDIIQVQIASTTVDFEKLDKLVRAAGGQNISNFPEHGILQAWLPIKSLTELASHKEIGYISQPQVAVLAGEFLQGNAFVTEGLSAMNGTVWQQAGYTGTGVKIGIIDLEFQGYVPLLGNELPVNITVKNFVDNQTDEQINTTGGPHGTACAEIIHDIAPGAELYFAKIATVTDLNDAIDWFIQQQVKVISISTVWWNETPGDGTGMLADIVNKAYNAGIFWAQAAGNERQRHWEGSFFDPDNDGVHNFTNADEVNTILNNNGSPAIIPAGTTIRVFLAWDDWALVNQDYELILARWNGTQWERVKISENTQNGGTGQTPTERITYTTSISDSTYGVVILRFNSDRAVHFELFMPAFGRLDDRFTTYTAAGSIANLADAVNAVTVAAVRRPFSPYEQALYSPEGPTNGPGGTAIGGLMKPDITAFAYVSTQSFGGGDSRFIGTSPAAPHVAGAAALVFSAYPSYTPMQIRTFLNNNAMDLGDPGLDMLYGYGLLNLGNPPIVATNTPTATPIPTVTPLATPTSTRLSTPLPTNTATAVPTLSPVSTATPIPTATRENPNTQIFLPAVSQ